MEHIILYKYFNGEASEEEKRMVQEWSELSEENHALFKRERQLYNYLSLAGLGSTSVPKRTSGYKKAFRYSIAAVASLILAFSANLIFNNRTTDPIAMQTITVPPGQRVNITLPDGSDVWLNAGSVFSYPTDFLKHKREVTLDGEGYFSVTHNENKPFVVKTFARDITVLGTEFDVEAIEEEGVFTTALLKGSVRIDSSDSCRELILSPGYQVNIDSHGELVTSLIPNKEVFKWIDGLYCFEEADFSDILKSLERYYDIRILLENESISNIGLTGKFRITDGLDYALRVLQTSIDFSFKRENDIVYIK